MLIKIGSFNDKVVYHAIPPLKNPSNYLAKYLSLNQLLQSLQNLYIEGSVPNFGICTNLAMLIEKWAIADMEYIGDFYTDLHEVFAALDYNENYPLGVDRYDFDSDYGALWKDWRRPALLEELIQYTYYHDIYIQVAFYKD